MQPFLYGFRKFISVWLIIPLFILSSCQETRAGRLIPTAELINLYYPPSLGYIREHVSSCMILLGTVTPYLHEQSTAPPGLLSDDIILTMGEADMGANEYFISQIGNDNIVFIVNNANPIEDIELNGLMEIFSGRQVNWVQGTTSPGQINLWVYQPDMDLMNWLSYELLDGINLTATSTLAPHPGVVLEEVSKDPGAIGFIPESWLESERSQGAERIKKLQVKNVPEEELSIPILAYLKDEPKGEKREFLRCMQEK